MLEWKMVGGAWLGNGFRIESQTPSRWILRETGRDGDDTVAPTELLAELPTLEACQFEAERLHTMQTTSTTRQRLGLIGVAAWGIALIGGSPVAFVAGAVIGTAAFLELAMTWAQGRFGAARDHVQ